MYLQTLRKIDVGVIFLENDDYHKFNIQLKPNTKLTNFQSFGIPTVATGYTTFREFGGEAYLPANNRKQLFESLDILLSSRETRERLAVDGLKISEKCSIENVAKMYDRVVDNYYAK